MGERRPRVLVVDDEAHNRELVARILRRDVDVVLATTAAEALAADAPVDAVITDERLDGDSGVALAIALKAKAPEVRIALLTGWSDDPAVIDGQRRGAIDVVLGKPCAPAELRAWVRAVVGAGSAG